MRRIAPIAVAMLLAGTAQAADPSAEAPPRPLAAPVAPVAQAQDGSPPPRLDPPLAQMAAAGDGVVSIGVNTSRMVPLGRPARDVVIGNPEVADVVMRSPSQAILVARGIGSTNVFFLDAGGEVIERLALNVHMDVAGLGAAMRDLLPEEPIEVSAVADSIVLSGQVRSERAVADAAAIAERFISDDAALVNMLRVVGEHQVLMKVRVSEVQKNALKTLGVNYNITSRLDSLNAVGTAIGTATSVTPSGATDLFTRLSLSNASGSQTILFDALEREGMVKTLAEPNLTAVSGETAELLAGGEFPVPRPQGDNQVTIEFKPFGVGLAFTPVVLSGGRISLRLSTEVSELTDEFQSTIAGVTVDGLTVRRASTTVELPSGGSLMIAGLLQNDFANQFEGLPGLQDLPILGALFRSNTFRQNQSELVVTVTCYLVEPTDHRLLALPTDGFEPGSDLDRLLMGRLYRTYAGAGAPPKGSVRGPIGYIVQ